MTEYSVFMDFEEEGWEEVWSGDSYREASEAYESHRSTTEEDRAQGIYNGAGIRLVHNLRHFD